MNEISIYNRFSNPVDMMTTRGVAIEMSGMYGAKNKHQGMLLALTCMVKGVDPISIAEDYHLIHGRLSMKTERMLSNLLDAGASVTILARTPEECAIEVEYQKRKVVYRITWEEAQNEPFPYEGKEEWIIEQLESGKRPKLKAKYRTPRSRMQMLCERLISDAVRSTDPRCCSGSYTPEEISDFDELQGKAIDVEATTIEPVQPAVAVADSPIVYGHIEEVEESTFTTAEPLVDPNKATGQQISEITSLFNDLGVSPDSQLKAFAKRGAADMGALTRDGADDLLNALRAKKEELSSQSKLEQTATSGEADGPASQAQIDRLRSLISQIGQQDGGPETVAKIKQNIGESGLSGLADLSTKEADFFESCLAKKNLQMFFDSQLKGAAKKAS